MKKIYDETQGIYYKWKPDLKDSTHQMSKWHRRRYQEVNHITVQYELLLYPGEMSPRLFSCD